MRDAVIFAVLGVLWAQHSRAERPPVSTISVRVFDQAGVRKRTLKIGLEEAGRILRSAGVEAAWIHCSVDPVRLPTADGCRDTPGPLTLVLQILQRPAAGTHTDRTAAGFTEIPRNVGFGTNAMIFYGRITRLPWSIQRLPWSIHTLLGASSRP
jgi:hypothetical protein